MEGLTDRLEGQLLETYSSLAAASQALGRENNYLRDEFYRMRRGRTCSSGTLLWVIAELLPDVEAFVLYKCGRAFPRGEGEEPRQYFSRVIKEETSKSSKKQLLRRGGLTRAALESCLNLKGSARLSTMADVASAAGLVLKVSVKRQSIRYMNSE